MVKSFTGQVDEYNLFLPSFDRRVTNMYAKICTVRCNTTIGYHAYLSGMCILLRKIDGREITHIREVGSHDGTITLSRDLRGTSVKQGNYSVRMK